MKRVSKGNHIGTINPLVDIYNATSLRYGLPCGGEDIDTFRGDIRLTKALGDESFITLGTDESAPPYEGEIVYKDDEGAICRCWNWRESVRTMLTESTKNAFLCIELVDTQREEVLRKALEYLAKTVEAHLGGVCEISVVDIHNKSIPVMEQPKGIALSRRELGGFFDGLELHGRLMHLPVRHELQGNHRLNAA